MRTTQITLALFFLVGACGPGHTSSTDAEEVEEGTSETEDESDPCVDTQGRCYDACASEDSCDAWACEATCELGFGQCALLGFGQCEQDCYATEVLCWGDPSCNPPLSYADCGGAREFCLNNCAGNE